MLLCIVRSQNSFLHDWASLGICTKPRWTQNLCRIVLQHWHSVLLVGWLGGGGGGALNKTIGSLNNEAQVLYRHCQQLSLTTTRTRYRGGSFLPRTIRDWNSLQECSRGDDCWHFCVTCLPLTSQLVVCYVLEKEFETVQLFKELWRELKCGGGDSSVVRAPDSWLKGRGFESLLERRENFLLQRRLSVLTLISVFVPPPCYHSST